MEISRVKRTTILSILFQMSSPNDVLILFKILYNVYSQKQIIVYELKFFSLCLFSFICYLLVRLCLYTGIYKRPLTVQNVTRRGNPDILGSSYFLAVRLHYKLLKTLGQRSEKGRRRRFRNKKVRFQHSKCDLTELNDLRGRFSVE